MKRLIKWLVVVLVVAVAAVFIWGYAPDTDAAAMETKYSSSASRLEITSLTKYGRPQFA